MGATLAEGDAELDGVADGGGDALSDGDGEISVVVVVVVVMVVVVEVVVVVVAAVVGGGTVPETSSAVSFGGRADILHGGPTSSQERAEREIAFLQQRVWTRPRPHPRPPHFGHPPWQQCRYERFPRAHMGSGRLSGSSCC